VDDLFAWAMLAIVLALFAFLFWFGWTQAK
jgi:hypothetical protein